MQVHGETPATPKRIPCQTGLVPPGAAAQAIAASAVTVSRPQSSR